MHLHLQKIFPQAVYEIGILFTIQPIVAAKCQKLLNFTHVSEFMYLLRQTMDPHLQASAGKNVSEH